MLLIGKNHKFGLFEFKDAVLTGKSKIKVSPDAAEDLCQTRDFIDFLLKNNIEVYGVTTGLADLRSQKIDSAEAAQLSSNLIESHDAGIGKPISPIITLGAMAARASSLAKGHSGFQQIIQICEHEIYFLYRMLLNIISCRWNIDDNLSPRKIPNKPNYNSNNHLIFHCFDDSLHHKFNKKNESLQTSCSNEKNPCDLKIISSKKVPQVQIPSSIRSLLAGTA